MNRIYAESLDIHQGCMGISLGHSTVCSRFKMRVFFLSIFKAEGLLGAASLARHS